MKTNNLLVIAPNFRLFIKDQIAALSHFFGRTTVVVPYPLFPKFMLNIPYIEKRLLFIKNAMESCDESMHHGIYVFCPKFFTLPLEVLRKRVPVSIAKTTLNELRRKKVYFDLIHCHRLDVGFSGALIKDIYDKPLVVTSHGSDAYDFPFRNSFSYSIVKYVLSRADQVIAVCKSDAEKLVSLGLPLKKVSIIPNGFNEILFKPISQQFAREKLGLPLHRKVILTVGVLSEVKGHTYLIDAMHIISKLRDDLVAIIIGTGPLEDKLKEKIRKLGLRDKVLLVGWESHERIPLWMNASDIFVLPSLNEGFPTVIPEAMACGKPVIGTRVGGIPDAILHNETGLLINPKDPEMLAQAIIEALNRRWDVGKILEHAGKYSLKNVVRELVQVYQHVMKT